MTKTKRGRKAAAMPTLDAEAATGPPDREPGQLAATIAQLFAASRAAAAPQDKRQVHVLSSGLQLTINTAQGDVIGLSRKGSVSDMQEAATVAAEAGWLYYSTEWFTRTEGGQEVRYLVLRPDRPPEPEDAPWEDPPVGTPRGRAAAGKKEDADVDVDRDPPDEEIRALLDHPGPWQDGCLTLRGPPGSRDAYLRAARRCQLRDMLKWVRQKYPGELAAWQVHRQRQQRTQALREGVARELDQP